MAASGAALVALATSRPGVAGAARQPLYINTAFGLPVAGPDGFFNHLMDYLLAPLGYDVTIQTPPAERALLLANSGLDDGDGPRIPGLTRHYPNLMRVPEPVMEVEFVAFTKRLVFDTDDWKSLAPYSVAMVTGWKILERNIRSHSELLSVKHPEGLFRLLNDGRTEVAVIDRFSGHAMARRVGLEDYNVLSPPLATTPMYLYLHSRHAQLVGPLTARLREARANGVYGRLKHEKLDHAYLDDPLR